MRYFEVTVLKGLGRKPADKEGCSEVSFGVPNTKMEMES